MRTHSSINQTISQSLATIMLCLLSLSAGQLFAHGSTEPQHGGVVKLVGDMSFELVNGSDKIDLYLLDDGEFIASKGMKAKIKITVNGNKSEVKLQPSGDNKFSASGKSIPTGAKVLVLVTLKDGYSKLGAKFSFD